MSGEVWDSNNNDIADYKSESGFDLKKCYVGYNKSETDRTKSSSGGIFPLIAKFIISNGGVVFGAAFDEQFLVYHKKIESIEQLDDIIGSKYLQSRMGNSFAEVKELLNQKKIVLFVGTTCQIAGLKSYLGKTYSNLLTIDFICLGVPSPKVWSDYLNTFFTEKPIQVNFKDKKRGWHTFSLYIKSKNKEFCENGKKNLFFSGYFKGLYSRPCCSECKIKQEKIRVSDITLSDSWGCENFALELDDNKGLSNIIIHSELGERLFLSIEDKLVYKETTFDCLIENNRGYYESKPFGKQRNQFWKEYNNIDKKKLFSKYCSSYYGVRMLFRRIRQRIRKVIIGDRK